VDNQILQGVMIGIVGMAILFAAMGVLILAMTLLERLFRNRAAEADNTSPDERPTVRSLSRETRDDEIAAAITTALVYLRSLEICEGGLGSTLEAGPSSWWSAGRAQQSPANALKVNNWRNQ
jgi:sodium pump decarboxylase gamma subunit